MAPDLLRVVRELSSRPQTNSAVLLVGCEPSASAFDAVREADLSTAVIPARARHVRAQS
jgi:hypothetical protein